MKTRSRSFNEVVKPQSQFLEQKCTLANIIYYYSVLSKNKIMHAGGSRLRGVKEKHPKGPDQGSKEKKDWP